MPDNASPVLATTDEIVALCREFPEAPIIRLSRHAIANGASLTREHLLASHLRFHPQRQGIPQMSSAISNALPAPNGMLSAAGLPNAVTFRIAVDKEIARLKDDGEPDALWLEELLPLYAAGMSPEDAARRIVARRYPEPRHTKASCRQGSLIRLLLDGWREWDFRRALRQTGRA